MATIGTTTQAGALTYPGVARIDRAPGTGHLWTAVISNAGTGVAFYRSTDNGGTWALFGTWVRGVTIQELSGLFIDNSNNMHIAYRTNESSQDRIYWIRVYPTSLTTSAEGLLAAPGNGGVAGSIHSGLDLAVVMLTDGGSRIAVGVGTTVGGNVGLTLYGLQVSPTGGVFPDNSVVSGTRQWMVTGSGRITPQLDIEHVGDGKSGGASPHLWVAFGRTDMRLVRCAWSGGRWTGPTSAVTLKTGLAAQDGMTGRWDGSRFLVCAPHPDAGFTDRVLVAERNRANSATTWRTSPAHPTGVVRHCTLSTNSINSDFRVYAVGTSSTVLYYVDYIRATGVWTSWAQVSATAISGATGNTYGARRQTYGNARYDVATQTGAASPWTLTHTSQLVSYAPSVPTWDIAAVGYQSGAAADVAAALPLDWRFADPDPGDAQSAYALSRQIGAGTLAYWRASDSTWQPAEVKNLSGSSIVTLASGWAAATDAAYSYRVKVWDSTDTASVYSDALVLIPSARANPTVTAPTAGGTVGTDTVTVTWTVAEQSAYRVTLATNPGGVVVHDSGWLSGTGTSYTPPTRLPDLSGWTVTLQTRNLEGLASTVQTVAFTVDYLEPATPALVATPQPANGIISVAIANPAAVGSQPALAGQDLYRRLVVTSSVLVTNPGFETGLTNWTGINGTLSQSSVQAHGGGFSGRLVPGGVSAFPRAEYTPTALDPTKLIYAAGWIRCDTAAFAPQIVIQVFNAGGGFLQTIATKGYSALAGAWLYLWTVGDASGIVGAARFTPSIGLAGTAAAGDAFYVDDYELATYNDDQGVRVAAGLGSGATYADWTAVSGIAYEYRVLARGNNGTSIYSAWTA